MSALLALEGEATSKFVNEWVGTIQWVGESPFRPHHKRKNWYVGVEVLNPPESHEWREKDIKFESMRASGPGGQHVNKSETAIRATHVPTGLTAIAQEERSQYLNKKLALSRLVQLIKDKELGTKRESRMERWQQHNMLERGNPTRTYEGKQFKLR